MLKLLIISYLCIYIIKYFNIYAILRKIWCVCKLR